MGKLNPKQEAFILAYIGESRFNATKAAIAAGYAERSAYSTGHDLLSIPEISARIKTELSNRSLTADAVLTELTDVALADWSDFITIRKNPRTDEVIDVKMDLTAKMKALELIGKAHGIFTERVDISGSMTSTIELVGISADDV